MFEMDFNAHEILARIRGQASQPQAPAEQAVPRPPVPAQSGQNLKMAPACKNIKNPTSLTLTPSQRQDNLNVRSELEKDIKKLQEENSQLRNENKQLKSDKERVEQAFMDYRVTSGDTVTRLREQIAKLTFKLNNQDRGAGAGRLYASPEKQSREHRAVPANVPGYRQTSYLPRSPTTVDGLPYSSENVTQIKNDLNPHLVEYLTTQHGDFRDPTFTELMRRVTPEFPKHPESLRRPNKQFSYSYNLNNNIQNSVLTAQQHGHGHTTSSSSHGGGGSGKKEKKLNLTSHNPNNPYNNYSQASSQHHNTVFGFAHDNSGSGGNNAPHHNNHSGHHAGGNNAGGMDYSGGNESKSGGNYGAMGYPAAGTHGAGSGTSGGANRDGNDEHDRQSSGNRTNKKQSVANLPPPPPVDDEDDLPIVEIDLRS